MNPPADIRPGTVYSIIVISGETDQRGRIRLGEADAALNLVKVLIIMELVFSKTKAGWKNNFIKMGQIMCLSPIKGHRVIGKAFWLFLCYTLFVNTPAFCDSLIVHSNVY